MNKEQLTTVVSEVMNKDELLIVEQLLDMWVGRKTYNDDREWLDNVDGMMGELAKATGLRPYDPDNGSVLRRNNMNIYAIRADIVVYERRTIHVSAKSEEEARQKALDGDLIGMNPTAEDGRSEIERVVEIVDVEEGPSYEEE